MIELLQMFLDFFVHLDTHLVELLQRYGVWIYAIRPGCRAIRCCSRSARWSR
jgi:hypothetical protein